MSPEARQVRLEVRWPEALLGKKVDLYTMVLAPAGTAAPRPGADPGAGVRPGRALPVGGVERGAGERAARRAYIWGVVAVEPASGAAWYKRLFIHDEQAKGPGR